METKKAFLVFAQRIEEGEEGIFWSERDLEGKESWVFGVGKKRNADFERGPFPFFSLTSFLGDEHCFFHFDEWYSNKNYKKLLLGDTYMRPLRDMTIPNLQECSNETEESFCQKVEQVKGYAENGELWVLNLAHELSGALLEQKNLLGIFYNFLKLKKAHAGGVWWTDEQKMCSMSPEIFIRQRGKTISTFPIKGTGTKEYLSTNEKEIAELSMVTDLLRNDLGQIAQKVWVERERVLTDCGHFFHAHAEIFAELKNTSLSWENYRKLLPCGSISGAPKKRVVETILLLEAFQRQFYTGTFGVKTTPEKFISNILIRTLFVHDNRWKFPVGAGLTYESDPLYEWQETLQKAKILQECICDI